ncbi:hypothetical protein [Tumebacillus permanentifrigoris]|uniref:Uracil DNA glycosylase superfamily protein n=1 Tax=Tumebacillus permanentifrigoris TaxID=378543 RepID=A0A316DA75_9BACL|nr:hypothetical protein [Tumebacillus permanentifrigoris]PWK13401.1 hypothetical protein C7459_10768 [Tumebacillus permanentifrigoris]
MDIDIDIDMDRLEHFLPKIAMLPPVGSLRRGDLLTSDFLLEQKGDLEIYYAPHNEYINTVAKICVLGITPGWSQMELAFRQVRDDLRAGAYTVQEMERRAKATAGLAGSMRVHLCEMLDELGVQEWLGISTTRKLFSERRDLIHTTSLIRNPVFWKGSNYTGHTPKITASPLLCTYAYEGFPSEWKQLQDPILIPLGKSVADTLAPLVEQGAIDRARCLLGFPHPSGANGHRKKQFAEVRENLINQVRSLG